MTACNTALVKCDNVVNDSHPVSAVLTGCIVPIVEGCYETFRNSVELKINENRVCGCELLKAPKCCFPDTHPRTFRSDWNVPREGKKMQFFFLSHLTEALRASSFYLGNTQQYKKAVEPVRLQ